VLAAGAFLAAALILAGSLLLMKPAPTESIYYGQWTAELRDLAVYDGTVLGATVGGDSVPGGRLTNSTRIREGLQRRAPIEIRAVAGSVPSSLAPLFSIADQRRRRVLLIGIDGHDLVAIARLRAADMRLDQPELSFDELLRGVEEGDTFDIALHWSGGEYCVDLNGSQRCGWTVSAGRGWSALMYSRGVLEDIAPLLDALWLAILAFPVGYWALRYRQIASYAIVIVLGLLTVSATTTFATPPALFVAALVGLSSGRLVRLRIARQERPASRR
jgi:hypothetical protein